MRVKIESSWRKELADEFAQSYFNELTKFVKNEYKEGTVYPAPKNIFRAFELCPFDNVKVVILGQDPYHGPRQANGLAFAVDASEAIPPSLRNIFKEIQSDLGKPLVHTDGDLSLGEAGGVTPERDTHRPGTHCRLSSRPRMGIIHGWCHPRAFREARASRLYALG